MGVEEGDDNTFHLAPGRRERREGLKNINKRREGGDRGGERGGERIEHEGRVTGGDGKYIMNKDLRVQQRVGKA